jgi:hypothetical protein
MLYLVAVHHRDVNFDQSQILPHRGRGAHVQA